MPDNATTKNHYAKDTASYKEVDAVLNYDPATGVFTWKQTRSGVKAGDQAGSVTWEGYRKIGVGGKYYMAHRLAWLLTKRKWPVKHIDHINRDRSDNRFCNLREVTTSQNNRNRRFKTTPKIQKD